jgi:Zn-dependent protease
MNFSRQQAISFGSFGLMVLVWWMMTGSLAVSVGMLVLILIHEMGHYYAAKRLGVAVTPPIFTPIGAVILTPPTANAQQEAYIAFAGPLVGTIGCVIALFLGLAMNVSVLVLVAHWGLILNLFNMIPLSPLDGGRISMAINRRMWIIGVPLMLYAMMSFGTGGMNLMLFIFIGMQAWQDIQYREQVARSYPAYFAVGEQVRFQYAAAFMALALFLSWAYFVPLGLIGLLRLFTS